MNYSKISRRFFAYCFDTIIVYGIICVLLLFLKVLKIFDISTYIENMLKGDFSFFTNYLLVCFLIYLAYEFIFLTSSLSSTPGKIILEMEVVSHKSSFTKVFIRSLVKVIQSLSCFIFISGLVAVFTEKKQTIHDLLAKTFVIDFDSRSQSLSNKMDSEAFHEEMKRRGIKTYSQQKALAEEMFGKSRKAINNSLLKAPLFWGIILILSIIIGGIYTNLVMSEIKNFLHI